MKQAENRTTCGVATAAGANCFAFDAIFLGEGEGNMVGLCKDRDWIECGFKDVAVALEGDVIEAEGGIRCWLWYSSVLQVT